MTSTKPTYLKDYQPLNYRVETVELEFNLELEKTTVRNTMRIIATENCKAGRALKLNGVGLKLLNIELDGKKLDENFYELTDEELLITDVPMQFTLTIVNEINPTANTDLEGLFVSGGNFCTQCEPHGFRHITYFIDRPDNMSRFTTKLIADKKQFPVLLSNGNCIASGDFGLDKHFSTWEDPFLKPSYLFALVGGKLDVLDDEFVTMSGRKVDLKVFVDPGELDKAQYAMDSLKKSMRWDEQTYGREYDLDIFMIVAVRDFNMGAMENKGLNIFNSKYILADAETATDKDFENVLVVVGHEYFHNWSGNRVTCRDWFQLSLKEGFTVFRDQTFSADHTSEAIKRIDDVNLLRTHQFAEDAGPTAHPVQPQSYLEMNNFYTMTIYHKGAEVVRMLRTLLGEKIFRKATDLYFDRHDGQAVTIEEFISAMEDAANIDLTQFRLWYSQAGTPTLSITDSYDADKQQYCLEVIQELPVTADKQAKQPMLIPLAIGLLDQAGNEIMPTTVMEIQNRKQRLCFDDIKTAPVPSLLRGFSAPIKLHYDYSDEQLSTLAKYDTDVFTRFEAMQQYATQQIEKLQAALIVDSDCQVDAQYIATIQYLLDAQFDDLALQALLLTLPSKKYLLGLQQDVDPLCLHKAWQHLRNCMAKECQQQWQQVFDDTKASGGYKNSANENARRRLHNVALSYLNLLDNGVLAWEQYQQANNMTDKLAALACLANSDSEKRQQALDDFYNKFKNNPNVLDKWFAVQAMTSRPDALCEVKQLMQSEAYDAKNPNAIRALIGSYGDGNIVSFHAENAEGYQFLAEQIIAIDKINKQVAARLVTPFLSWHNYDKSRQQQMRKALEMIAKEKELSNNTFELVDKALAS